MAKTKAQLRAEAVERLTKLNEHGYWEFPVHVALCGRDVPDVDEERAIIADLLTDDCGPCYACAKLAELMAENNALRAANQSEELPETPVFGNNPQETPSCGKDDDGLDSREKLEADVRKNLAIMKLEGYVFDMIHGWLDRQAAITERHILTHPDERDEQIAELQREVDRLTRENARLSSDEFYLRCTLVDMNGEVVG